MFTRVRIYEINKVAAILMLLLAITITASAQDDVEYRMEIGAGVGMTTYHGDFSSALFKKSQPAGAVIFRRVINPYTAVRISGMYTGIKGSTEGKSTYYPDLAENGYSFSNPLADISATFEYNFLPYGTGRDYRGAKKITPFISLGIGMTYASCKGGTWDYSMPNPYSSTKSVVTANIPIGVGVKYKVASRLNLSLDWQMHFSLSDNLDGIKDPYRVKTSGIFKNTDCYSTLMLALTYSFSPKCQTCHKDR
ncbi:MAG: outer membrane beta-barrel protein [Prevotella sp.]|nr:outer membrane beta-barrel protein [Candidatus Prevotella equi]